MLINGERFPTLAVYNSFMTVPDCFVAPSNKLGTGHGEAKFYITSRIDMEEFYGGQRFSARCFLLKKDLINYLTAVKSEYMYPSQEYRDAEKLPILWNERMAEVEKQDDAIFFTIKNQSQIQGPRGYINSADPGYQLLRKLALPLVSYVYVEKVGKATDPFYYWKLFVDFDAIYEKKNGPLVFNYGKKANILSQKPEQFEGLEDVKPKVSISQSREGQTKYREGLLEQCRFCPISMISDDRLLIASHIKPWAASNDDEKIDPYNGYMLSPLYDKLFDRGYITFTKEKHIILSEAISSYTWKQIGLKNDTYLQTLPMDPKREAYLQFHHDSIFKGSISD